MSKVIFISGIENLRLRTAPGRGDAVANAFQITTDRDFLGRIIPDSARQAIGVIEHESLLSGRPVAYALMPDLPLSSEVDAKSNLVAWLQMVNSFLLHVWFVKDNAVGQEFGYLIWSRDRRVVTTRNFLGLVVTDSSAETQPVHLTTNEFREAREFFAETMASRISSKARKLNRWDRALSFISAARAAGDAPVKLANYCTALEALFSNDTAELTHKLSERTGWFVGGNAKERLDVFQRVRKAYGIRSKVVHGAADWGRDKTVATETSQFLDSMLRRVLRLIRERQELQQIFTEESESGKKRHEEFLLSLVLGDSGIHKAPIES